jgi:hypothetical protein
MIVSISSAHDGQQGLRRPFEGRHDPLARQVGAHGVGEHPAFRSVGRSLIPERPVVLSAGRAQARGGPTAAAAFGERAVQQ